MMITAILTITIFTILLTGYMKYQFSKIPVETKAYLEKTRK